MSETTAIMSDSQEQERLKNLESYSILDTDPEPEFDEITELASQITGLPIALVSLVDDKRQWFKSKVGLTANETAREISFCQYTIKEDHFYEVKDARKNDLFKNNPLVKGNPNIGYYYGYPIESAEGFKLGSLCTIGHDPHELTEDQKRALEILGHQVENLLKMRKQNQELAQERDRANENARAKSTFLSTMSHEIRTPLNSIINFSHLLANEPLNASAEQYVKNLRFSSENLLTLINDILDFNKLESNKLKLNAISFDLQDLLKKIREVFSFKARENETTIELSWDESLPRYFKSDNHRLTQVLNNLVSNATKFTEKGTITLIAKAIEKKEDTVKVRISVQDNGIGIPKDKQKSIFKKFTQASAEIAQKYGGTGLGLNISSRLLKLFNSELQLKSELGVGSTFYFDVELPVSTRKNTQSHKLKNLQNSLHGMKVLLAEDNELNAQIVSRLCEIWGVELKWAKNGEEALEKIKAQTYHLILMDIEMPKMKGTVATQKLRSNPDVAKIPVIAMTAHALTSLEEMEGGDVFDGLVTKPISAENLHETLMEYYEGS